MMRCPVCKNTAHTRTSRYLTNKTKESYYQCQNIRCSCAFKTLESLARIISAPETEDNFTIVT
ncbi:MAG: ogr/Delta-like zinc finger family protein [Candidatus Arsenophonus phytopathogenicus]